MTRIIAHRGNSSEAPENTTASFESAIGAGATLLECDVQMTADGHIVVIHDPTLERTGGRAGDVRSLSLAEVQSADVCCAGLFGAAFSPQRVLTLGQLLASIKGRARLMVEIKKDSSQEGSDVFERRIAAEIVKSGVRVTPDMETDVALLSFSTRVLERMAQVLPDAPRGHLFYRDPEDVMFAAAQKTGAIFVMPEKGHVSKDLVARAAERNLGVATWVCDDPVEFGNLARLGLLGIGTNRPVAMVRAAASDPSFS
jgi:glycerophosphoryl diester phosphodiesterase